MARRRILATGGAGFIGSHVAAELMAAGHEVVVLDNFENAEPAVIDRLAAIGPGRPALVEGDVRDRVAVAAALAGVDAVVHLAGKKAVGESVTDPPLLAGQSRRGARAAGGDGREGSGASSSRPRPRPRPRPRSTRRRRHRLSPRTPRPAP